MGPDHTLRRKGHDHTFRDQRGHAAATVHNLGGGIVSDAHRATDYTFWWKEDSPIVSVPTGATDHTFWEEEDGLSV